MIALIPMDRLNAEQLMIETVKVLEHLEGLGLDVDALCVDGLAVNIAFYKELGGGILKISVPNPANPSKNL
jgi:hypothetical protein